MRVKDDRPQKVNKTRNRETNKVRPVLLQLSVSSASCGERKSRRGPAVLMAGHQQ